MSFGSWLRGVGRKISSGVQSIGGFVRRGAEKVGDFARKIDFSKVGDISRKVRDIAGTVAGMGIPFLSTAAGAIGKGADVVSRVADRAGKIKEGIQVAGQVGAALEKPSFEGVVKAGKRAYEYGKGF